MPINRAPRNPVKYYGILSKNYRVFVPSLIILTSCNNKDKTTIWVKGMKKGDQRAQNYENSPTEKKVRGTA
jgi:hypothetical protein